MSRHLTLLLCALAVVAGCSRNPERSLAASPTAPSAAAGLPPGSLLGASSVAPGGVSGPMDVSFPARNESFLWRNQMESIYRDVLGRGLSPTVVDPEGEVVWTQEYIRYRVNGCDHGTAVQRVQAQIAGNAAGGVCGAPPDGLILFPSRADSLQFRIGLESTYAAMGRGQSPTSVDMEGGVIWTQEYLRYRVNACDHATASAKVASQIVGGAVSETCVPPCAFSVSPAAHSLPPSGGTFTLAVTRTTGLPGSCSYSAESLGSFVTITGGATGLDGGTVTYTVPASTGPGRSQHIRVRWPNGSVLVEINQGGSFLNASIILVDPAISSGQTIVCQIRTKETQCQLIANANLSGTSTFAWAVTYNYGGPITRTQTSTSNTFTFTETCGGSGSSAGGTDTPMNVTLTVTDAINISETTTAVFTIRLSTC